MMHLAAVAKIALVAASMLDAGSSAGKIEDNPVLAHGGRFTVGSAAIKFALLGGALVFEHVEERRHPEMVKPLAWTNAACAAALTAVAVRNFGVK